LSLNADLFKQSTISSGWLLHCPALQGCDPDVCEDEKHLSCFWAANTTAAQRTLLKAGEAQGRKTHLKPWTIYCTSTETAIRRPDLTAVCCTANTAEPPTMLLEPCFSSSVSAVQAACRQAMPIRYDPASHTGNTKTITVIPRQFPSCSSLSISMGYYVYPG